jgi:hypothetical protein
MKPAVIILIAAIAAALAYVFYQTSNAKKVSLVNNPGVAPPAGVFPSNNALAKYVAPSMFAPGTGPAPANSFTGIAMYPSQAQLTAGPSDVTSPDLNGTLPLAPRATGISSPLDYGATPALATGIESPGTDIFSEDYSQYV